jgi:hypothetical protein
MIAVAASAILLGTIELKRRSARFRKLSAFHSTEAKEYARYAETFDRAVNDGGSELWLSARRADPHLRRFWEHAEPRDRSTPDDTKGTGMLVIRPRHSDALLADALARYHELLVEKYLRAARYPWLPIAPDPPEPN